MFHRPIPHALAQHVVSLHRVCFPSKDSPGIRLFATDVDGVLTDAGMLLRIPRRNGKSSNRDGMGIKLLQKAGIVGDHYLRIDNQTIAPGAKLTIPEV